MSQLGRPRKEKVPRAREQDRPEVPERRREFGAQLAGVDPGRLAFGDEGGADTALTRTSGRAPAGQRVSATTPGQWGSITLTSAPRRSGVTAPLAGPGATATALFEPSVTEMLVPAVVPDDVVIWDNLTPHPSEEAVEAVDAVGAEVVPLPPWGPDLTPIEEMISTVKGALRSAGARTTEAVSAAFGSAVHEVTPENSAGWFQDRAAYAMRL